MEGMLESGMGEEKQFPETKPKEFGEKRVNYLKSPCISLALLDSSDFFTLIVSSEYKRVTSGG